MKNGTPKELCFESIKKCIKNPNAIPKKPAKYPKIVYINLNILIAKRNELSGIANADIPTKATIILAETAASPRIRAPIIPYSCTKR